ncbi:deoxyribonuclease IV [Schlesneria paludicola]|uniref:deoxyribonuclease IV n=1 Tax=Schlesneria paludicola TaxID=360056 RepID=UPI00029A5315|nr:deoxyribonuclease IV [Schlesneria paludicola]
MPLFGSHLSIAGGLYKAVEAAAELGMSTVQIFTHSPSQWSVKPVATDVGNKTSIKTAGDEQSAQWEGKLLADDDIRRFREAIERTQLRKPCAHDSYLINLATPDDALWQKSIEAIVAELLRAESLGLDGVVMHPGSFVKSTEEIGQRRIVAGLDEAHRRTKGVRCQYWLETTAGQGTNLGHRFEQIAFVLREVKEPERLGTCVDSCHIFAAGYPLQSKAEYQATMHEFDDTIGIDRIRAWHLNDSKKPLGSRVDRHEHIGEGCLGLEPFRHIVNDPRFAEIPMYLETEKGERDGVNLDAMNLATLRGLMSKS